MFATTIRFPDSAVFPVSAKIRAFQRPDGRRFGDCDRDQAALSDNVKALDAMVVLPGHRTGTRRWSALLFTGPLQNPDEPWH